MFEKNDSGLSIGYKNRRVVEMGRSKAAHGMLMLCQLETEKTRFLQLAKLRMAKKNGGKKKDANQEAKHNPINNTRPSIDEGKNKLQSRLITRRTRRLVSLWVPVLMPLYQAH